MKKIALILCSMLVVTACARPIPNDVNPAYRYGEAVYFEYRCPEYKAYKLQDALLLSCLSYKAHGQACMSANTLMSRFLKDTSAGFASLKAKYENVPKAEVCKIAEARFGKNGTVFKGGLTAAKESSQKGK